jgi:hypothetical protein
MGDHGTGCRYDLGINFLGYCELYRGGQLTGQLIGQSSHWLLALYGLRFLASRETVFSARFN